MKKQVLLSGAVLTAMAAGQASAVVYTDSASFLAATQAGYFYNDFADAVPGASPDLNYSQGGFEYTVGADGPNMGGLYNDTGLISTNNATDGILVTFTSGNVTAVGGNFWATDINVFPITADITVMLSDGTVETFTSSSSSDFRGFTSNVSITSLFIDAEDDDITPIFAWSTMDNLYVGMAIPAPASVALLGLGGLVATRRRR